jgi:hypothetical protein
LKPKRDEADAVNATWAVFNTEVTNDEHYKQAPNEVFIDNAAEISVMHPRFLTDIRDSEGAGIMGLSGSQKDTPKIGHLEGFFDCNSCTDCVANILSRADIEDKYDITYSQGKSYVVHLPGRDLAFVRRGKFYVADMSDWIVGPKLVNTTTDTSIPIPSERWRGQKEMEFVRSAGYPSEKEAIHLVTDGNIASIDIPRDDIRFKIFGRPAAAIRGKAKMKKARRNRYDLSLQQEGSKQVLYADIIHVGGHHYLVSVSEPLQLTIFSGLVNEKTETIGIALQTQLDLLRS